MSSLNVARKLIESHLESGEMTPGEEIALHIDQTLTQDATGTLVMQELEALGLDRARTEVSVQYVDHNLLQTDEKNAEDHEYLRTAAQRFGLWFSKPGNGVSHPTHMQRFGIPGKTMVGSDSHTPAAGSLGMLAIGVGGLEVALAITGRPLQITDQLLVTERQFDNLERRIEIFGRLAEHAQRVLIGLKLSRRIGRRITADTAGVERLHVKFGKLAAGCSGLGVRVGLLLITVADLAPFPCPAILVEIGERVHHRLGILAANLLERIETPGAAHEFGLDLFKRALARTGRLRRRCLHIHCRTLDQS